MKKHILLGLFLLSASIQAQNVGVGTNVPAASAKLDVTSTNSGVLIPRVALTMTTAPAPVTAPATSLMVYNTATVADVTPGFYYWNGSIWVRFNDRTNWTILGNGGTTAGTNFIGTTDAQDFVVKTNGSAAANERLRILSGGTGVYNNATPFAGDVFSVYGTGYTGATNALGTFALNAYVGAGGVGVYGESNSAAANNGIAIYGNLIGTSTATGTASYGVYGENSTTPAGTGIGIGVGGVATATTGSGRGVNGSSASPTGIGVAGFNSGITGNSYGIYGQTSSVAGVGIIGINAAAAYTTNLGVGVFGRAIGTSTTGASIGVRGYADGVTGNGYAFYGQALSSAGTGGIAFVTSTGAGWQGQNAGTGDGLRGYNTSATPATAGAGVYGQTTSTVAMGGDFFNGSATGTGLSAVGNNAVGFSLVGGTGAVIIGTGVGTLSVGTTAVGGTGIIAAGNNLATFPTLTRGCGIAASGTQFGVAGIATTMVNTAGVLNNANALLANASAGGYFEMQNAGTAQAWAYVAVREVGGAGGLRKIIGTGTVNTIVKDLKGDYVALSCPETPENLFQDYGQGQLVNGKAHIELDPILSKNIIVNEKHPLRVFIQLEGDCEGVFVTNKTQTGFDVTELKGGTSNVSFSYTIAANRADEVLPDGSLSKYSEERFAPAPGPQTTTQLKPIAKEVGARNDAIKTPLVTEPVNILPSTAETKKTKEHIKLTSN